MKDDLKLSVIIPTLNEEGFIDNLLNDVVTQEGYQEVVIADSGSTDKTEAIVKTFVKRYPSKNIKFVKAPKKGLALARNTGVKNSTAAYLVFLDADSRIPKMFFENAFEEMKKRDLDIAGCFLETVSSNLLDKAFFFIQKYLFHIPLQYTKHPASAGAGIMIKRSFHEKIGGFNEKIAYAEDFDYFQKASHQGIFRMLKSTYVVFSVRRFAEEGRLKLWLKYAKAGIYYLLNIKNFKIDYEFGKFSKNDQNNRKVEEKT